MKLYDGKKLVEITMHLWDEREANMSPDFSNDFFEAGGLKHIEQLDAYLVDDVEYCIDQANDWANFSGDFAPAVVFGGEDEAEEEREKGLERMVFVDVIQE